MDLFVKGIRQVFLQVLHVPVLPVSMLECVHTCGTERGPLPVGQVSAQGVLVPQHRGGPHCHTGQLDAVVFVHTAGDNLYKSQNQYGDQFVRDRLARPLEHNQKCQLECAAFLQPVLAAHTRLSNIHILLELHSAVQHNCHLVFEHTAAAASQKQNKKVQEQDQVASQNNSHGSLHNRLLFDVLDTLLVRFK